MAMQRSLAQLRISPLYKQIYAFSSNDEQEFLDFPASLNSCDREDVRQICKHLDLRFITKGDGTQKAIRVLKTDMEYFRKMEVPEAGHELKPLVTELKKELAQRTIQLGVTQQLLAQKSPCCLAPTTTRMQGTCGHIVCSACAAVRMQCKCGQVTEWRACSPTVLEAAHKSVAYFILELEQNGKATVPDDAKSVASAASSASSSSSSSAPKKKKSKKVKKKKKKKRKKKKGKKSDSSSDDDSDEKKENEEKDVKKEEDAQPATRVASVSDGPPKEIPPEADFFAWWAPESAQAEVRPALSRKRRPDVDMRQNDGAKERKTVGRDEVRRKTSACEEVRKKTADVGQDEVRRKDDDVVNTSKEEHSAETRSHVQKESASARKPKKKVIFPPFPEDDVGRLPMCEAQKDEPSVPLPFL